MDFIDALRQFAAGIEAKKEHILTEEATKNSLVLPFLQLLGYDIFDPAEVVPEFTADIGTKKGEKVDYAIAIKKQPVILIEVKSHEDPLSAHDAQLFRYFTATPAKFAILTNGVLYKFYTDLQEPNKLDATPFLEFDLLDIKEELVSELRKFQKNVFDAEALFSDAANLKYARQVIDLMNTQFRSPDEEFIKYILKNIYPGRASPATVDKFKPLIQKALSQYINEQVNATLKKALTATKDEKSTVTQEPQPEEKSQIVTTMEELEGFFTIKFLLHDMITPDRISYKDTQSYFGVFIDGPHKWVCRLYFNQTPKTFALRNDPGKKIQLDQIEDLIGHRAKIISAMQGVLGQDNTSVKNEMI